MPIPANAQLGMSMRFDVVIDGFDLGSWTSCKGLNVTFKHEKVNELGVHGHTTFIPGRVEFTPISLQRAMVANDWGKTKAWLADIAEASFLAGAGIATATSSAKITLRDAGLQEVAAWELVGVLPSAWKAPQLDANGKAVALETLELVHEGFLG